MIQYIHPHILSNAFKPRPSKQGDFVLVYGDGKAGLFVDSQIPRYEEFCELTE